VHEALGSVDRVDDPTIPAGAFALAELLAEDRVSGKRPLDRRPK
jgi:hypothetical protein